MIVWEHTFVSATGSGYARFQRALASRNPTMAWAAAAELAYVDLADALSLCLLVAGDPAKYGLAAARWHARYCRELRGVTLTEAQLVLAALTALPAGAGASAAADALAQLAEQRGLDRVAQVLEEGRG
jgi:hypothetical protein